MTADGSPSGMRLPTVVPVSRLRRDNKITFGAHTPEESAAGSGFPPAPTYFQLRQVIEKRFRFAQVHGAESLGERVVNRRQQIASFFMPALIAIQPGHARRSTKFQRLRLLPAGDLDGLMKTLFHLDNLSRPTLNSSSTGSCPGEDSACTLH